MFSCLLDIIKEPTSLADGRDDGGKIVIGKYHIRRFLADIAAIHAHGNTNIGAFQRRRVVDTIASHDTVLAPTVEGIKHAELSCWTTTSDHKW